MSSSDSPGPSSNPGLSQQEQPPTQPQQEASVSAQSSNDRSELISRARTFLTSPQVRDQDLFAKRTFLLDKGLTEPEIELLLRELPPQLPTIPPRAYPQPPPSRLPLMLLAIARIFSWIAGGSAVLIFIYHRFLLPRMAATFEARHSIKHHHTGLLKKLNSSLEGLKETQNQSYSVLPRPQPFKEPAPFADYRNLSDVVREAEKQKLEAHQIHPISLLRCAIEEFHKQTDEYPRTEDLFLLLEGRFPWLMTEDGIRFEQKLWDILSTSACFEASTPESTEGTSQEKPPTWKYIPPKPQPPTVLQTSLTNLSSTLKSYQPTKVNPSSHTLKTLSDFTGYISSQLYLPYRPPPLPGAPLPIEEELKKDIRALKGLVLNRRTFMSTIPRPGIGGVSRSIQ